MKLYAVMAEFHSPLELLRAAKDVRDLGYTKLDAYSPFPIEGLSEALRMKRDRVALVTLIGGVTSGLSGYLMQYYANVIDYPLNIAGRPHHSWPAFIPVTFEMTVLGAALSAALGMLALNRLPRLHHPTFNCDEFIRASKDRFFLSIEARDPLFDFERAKSHLSELKPLRVWEVPSDE